MPLTVFNRDKVCLFCDRKKDDWKSSLLSMIPSMKVPLFVVTVCPECRKKHTIQEMYEKITTLMGIEFKNYVDATRMRNICYFLTTPKVQGKDKP